MKYIVDIKGEIEGDYEIIGKYEESELIKAYTKGFDTGVETVKNERPQGEWIRTALYGQTCYECDNCHLHYDIMTNFCPNCGAKMEV